MFTEITTVTETKSTVYKCSVCDFQTPLNDGIVRHYAINHACKKSEGHKNYEHNAYKFDTEEDAKVWLDEGRRHCSKAVVWTGPGWYFLRVINGDHSSFYSLLPTDKYCQVLEEDSARINMANHNWSYCRQCRCYIIPGKPGNDFCSDCGSQYEQIEVRPLWRNVLNMLWVRIKKGCYG